MSSAILPQVVREHCAQCQLPTTVCLCAYVHPQTCPLPIWVLQHPSEASHAKSTVPLLRLALPEITVKVAEQCAPPKALTEGGWWLLYPDESAVAIEDIGRTANSSAELLIKGLIVLDGTWRKTRRLLYVNSWLATLPKLSFSKAPAGQYTIRKGPGGQSLSTLESVAYVLQHVSTDFSAEPLHTLLAQRVAQFQKFGHKK